jgi:hypothetical protein
MSLPQASFQPQETDYISPLPYYITMENKQQRPVIALDFDAN